MDSSFANRRVLVIGIFVLLLVLLPFIVVAVQIASDLRSRANISAQPKQVIFSNITSNSVTISYTTDEAVTGQASASGGTSGIISGLDTRDVTTAKPYKLHYIPINNLQADAEYEVTINSGGESFTDPTWKVKTSPIGELPGTPDSILISVEPAITEAVVYAVAGNASGNSSVASNIASTSNITVQKNNLVGADGKQIVLDDKDIVVFVEAGAAGRGQVQFKGTQRNAPKITLRADAITFDPKVVITPGASLTPIPTPPPVAPPPPASSPVSTPVSGPTVDPISLGLLTQTYSTGAEAINPTAPYNIFISNVTSSGFTVNWLTKEPTIGLIEILNGSNRTQVLDRRDASVATAKLRYTHSVSAEDPGIPANSIFKFQIVSNNIKYGQNVLAIATDFNNQFKDFASSLANPVSSAVLGGEPALSFDSSFTYEPNRLYLTDTFAVKIPAAPSTAPLPNVVQGNVQAAVAKNNYLTVLDTVSKINSKLSIATVDTERDYLVATRTANSFWSTSLVTNTMGYSLSIGSTLLASMDKFISADSNTQLSMRAYGPFSQFKSKDYKFSANPESIVLADPGAVVSIQHGSLINTKRLVGVNTPNNLITVQTPLGSKETAQAPNNFNWQLTSKLLVNGLNELNFGFASNNNTSYLVIYDEIPLAELPTTALPNEFWYLILGTLLLGTGILLSRRYSVIK